MIQKSIYRKGGTIHWGSTWQQVIDAFKNTPAGVFCVQISALDKGMGKSTAFESLSSYVDGLSVEGDVMSVIAATLADNRRIKPDWKITDIANGHAIPGFIPWTVKPPKEKRGEIYSKALEEFLPGYKTKISLCTAFHGGSRDALIAIVPDYGFYVKNINVRTEHMIKDPKKTQEWRDHIKKHHQTLKWPEFRDGLNQKVEKWKQGKTPVVYVPNFSIESLEPMLLSNAAALVSQLLAIHSTGDKGKYEHLSKPWLRVLHPVVKIDNSNNSKAK